MGKLGDLLTQSFWNKEERADLIANRTPFMILGSRSTPADGLAMNGSSTPRPGRRLDLSGPALIADRCFGTNWDQRAVCRRRQARSRPSSARAAVADAGTAEPRYISPGV